MAISQAASIDQIDHMVLHRTAALAPSISEKFGHSIRRRSLHCRLVCSSRGKIPIVRVGNRASYPEQHVHTLDFGEMDAYLIEARSIGGLSGSPAFCYAEPGRSDEVRRRFSGPTGSIPEPRPGRQTTYRSASSDSSRGCAEQSFISGNKTVDATLITKVKFHAVRFYAVRTESDLRPLAPPLSCSSQGIEQSFPSPLPAASHRAATNPRFPTAGLRT